jgi:hypothetical protein
MRPFCSVCNVVFSQFNALESRMPTLFPPAALLLARTFILPLLPLAFLTSLSAPARADDAPAACKYINVAELPLRYLGPSFQRPDDTRLPLYLYLARLQGGDAAIAARELASRFAADKERRWPAPVADFYLGRLDAGALLAAAVKEPALAFAHGCEAKQFVAELARAKGDKEGAKALTEARRVECASPPAK